MKNRIVSKGVAPDVIDRIISYAVELNEANISQETLKGSSREISHEAVDYFNKIYQEAMDICKIGAAFYVDNPVKKNQFTFSRIVKNMNANRALAEEEEQQSTD